MLDIFKPYRGLPKEVYIIFLSRMINAAGLFIFPLFTLILTEKIGLSKADTGFWIMVIGLIFIPSNLIGGKLTDMIGRKKLIVICEGIGGLMYVICGFLPASMLQIYLIIMACFFFGMAEPANNAIIADITTPENRDGAYSLSYMGFNMGFAIGPTVGGLLFKNHYSWIFWGDALTLFVALTLVILFVRETFGDAQEDPGEGRAMEQHTDGSIWKVLLERPVLIGFALALLFYNFSYAQWHYLLPLHMEQNNPGSGAALYGLLASLNGIVVMIFTPLITSTMAKMTNLRRIAIGGVLYMVGFGLFGFVTGNAFFAFCCVVFTLGEIMITISYMPYVANRTPASHRGRMNAVMPIIMGIGYSMGPLIMGRGLKFFTIESGWKLIGVIMAIGVVAITALEVVDRRMNLVTDEVEE